MTLTPLSWNTRILPDETSVSIALCANRPVSDGTLPRIVSTAATFE